MREAENLKRPLSHPLHLRLQELTTNRVKRQSTNHFSKTPQSQHTDDLLLKNQQLKNLQDCEVWTKVEINVVLDIPGVEGKVNRRETELRSLPLEVLDKGYPATTWTRVWTGRSAKNAARNGRGGVYMNFPDGSIDSRSFSTARFSTNFRAGACALLLAAQSFRSPKPEII